MFPPQNCHSFATRLSWIATDCNFYVKFSKTGKIIVTFGKKIMYILCDAAGEARMSQPD